MLTACQMDSFSIYADYGAQFDTLYQDFKVLHNLDPRWTSYERGVEALSSIVTSVNNRGYTDKKSLTFPDLLIKVYPRCNAVRDQNLMHHQAFPTRMQISTFVW